MFKKKLITKNELEKYISKLDSYKEAELQQYINDLRKQVITVPFSTTPPGKQPPLPPGL